jgi:hypothetical protein
MKLRTVFKLIISKEADCGSEGIVVNYSMTYTPTYRSLLLYSLETIPISPQEQLEI